MGVIVVLSGVAVVYYQHATRMAYARLTVLQSERDRLQVAHGQLLLERSTLSTEARVEEIARHRLHMAPPASNAIWVLEATAP